MPAMAEAVSWQAGAVRRVLAKAGVGERAGEWAEVSAGRDEFRGAGEVEAKRGEDFGAPLFRVERDELGVSGVGVLGYGRGAEVGEQVFGQVEPGRAG